MRTNLSHERIFFSLTIIIVSTFVFLIYSGHRSVTLEEESNQAILSDGELAISDKIEEKNKDVEEKIDNRGREEYKMKCGTGALLEILKMQQNIAGPSYGKSEVHFWNKDHLYQQGIEYYKVSEIYNILMLFSH